MYCSVARDLSNPFSTTNVYCLCSPCVPRHSAASPQCTRACLGSVAHAAVPVLATFRGLRCARWATLGGYAWGRAYNRVWLPCRCCWMGAHAVCAQSSVAVQGLGYRALDPGCRVVRAPFGRRGKMPGRYLSCLSHRISCFKPAAAKKLLWSRLCSACLNLGTACGGARVCKPGARVTLLAQQAAAICLSVSPACTLL